MQSVSHIFGNKAKVKVMRLFVFNPSLIFTSLEVVNRVKERKDLVYRELNVLIKAGLIKKRTKGYVLNTGYKYLSALENFLIDAAPITSKDIVKKISSAGNIKLLLISGIFLHDVDSRVDILVVGDRIKQSKLLSAISSIESLLGKEIRYAAFETLDFKYRLSIYDKFIKDILDYQHEKILNKIGV